jgi:ketopantoate reductase
MKDPVVIVGMGEMAGVFARGFLRLGHPVFPVTRETSLTTMAGELPTPAMVLVAVAENDLHPVLEQLPSLWQERIVLLQNELLPRDWRAHDLVDPTVISVWFEKKKGQDYKVLIPSPVFGPQAQLIANALNAIDIPCNVLDKAEDLEYELVRKNVYILTTNIAGLVAGGTVSELWKNHEQLARDVANDVMDIQAYLTNANHVNRERLINGMLEAFDGDPDHGCMGRSAPARLARALEIADQAGLEVKTLRAISEKSTG